MRKQIDIHQLAKQSLVAIVAFVIFYAIACYSVDRQLAYFLYAPHPADIVHKVAQWVTYLGDSQLWLPILAMGFVVCAVRLVFSPDCRCAKAGLFVFAAMSIAIIMTSALKFLLGRYRPLVLFSEHQYGFHFLSRHFLENSTPSGHATRIFAFATASFLAIRCRYWGTMIFLIAIALAFSRLVLGMHYLSDVVFGALIGILVPLWLCCLLQKNGIAAQ